jgi:hypothetical protein
MKNKNYGVMKEKMRKEEGGQNKGERNEELGEEKWIPGTRRIRRKVKSVKEGEEVKKKQDKMRKCIREEAEYE